MAAFAGMKTTILGGVLALMLLIGVVAPTTVQAAGTTGVGYEPAPIVQYQEEGDDGPQVFVPESGINDSVFIGLAAASFAVLCLIGLGLGFYGLRED